MTSSSNSQSPRHLAKLIIIGVLGLSIGLFIAKEVWDSASASSLASKESQASRARSEQASSNSKQTSGRDRSTSGPVENEACAARLTSVKVRSGRTHLIDENGDLMYADFARRPLPVEQSDGRFEWTKADENEIKTLTAYSRNDAQMNRFLADNEGTLERQLIYRTNASDNLATLAAAIPATAKGDAASVATKIPGLKGEVFDVQLRNNKETVGDDDAGGFTGAVAGYPQSRVTAAYYNGAETIIVEIPERNLQLLYESRAYGDGLGNELLINSMRQGGPVSSK